MIECMKEVLYYESCNKIIIVVIYSLFFVDFMFLRNMFFFFDKENVVKVVNIYDKFMINKNDYLKMLVIIEFKMILFFLNVFFVEGLIDKIIFEVIFRKVKEYLKFFDENCLILSYEICFMGGKGKVKKYKGFVMY